MSDRLESFFSPSVTLVKRRKNNRWNPDLVKDFFLVQSIKREGEKGDFKGGSATVFDDELDKFIFGSVKPRHL